MTTAFASTNLKEYQPHFFNHPRTSASESTSATFNSITRRVNLLTYKLSSVDTCFNQTFLIEETKKQANINRLQDIATLKYNWNGNGADIFSSTLINKSIFILNDIVRQPKIFPTARNSIQFEFEKPNGDYLEFEIYEDHVSIYIERDTGEEEYDIPHNSNVINRIINKFYGI